MRFIIREQEYEKLVAAGKFRYQQQGQPIGTSESWRLTQLVGGYNFLRVDLDARQTPDNDSTLYHLAISPGRNPDRLKFRHFSKLDEIAGDVQLDKNRVSLYRDINGRRYEDEVSLPEGYSFWFPSAIGLALLSETFEEGIYSAVTIDPKQEWRLIKTQVKIERKEKDVVAVIGRKVTVQRYLIFFNDQLNQLWLDAHYWPVLLERDDGFRAIETQYIRYRQSAFRN